MFLTLLKRIIQALAYWRSARKPTANPRLIMTLLVRNEAEKLERNLAFHHAMGVDGFIVTDNNSQDTTMDILRYYKQKGWVLEIIEEPATGYEQKRWVDRMIETARSRYQADWIINADADEFWYAPSGSLKQELKNCKGNIVHCQSRSMYPEIDKPFYQWRQRVEFIDDASAYGLSPYHIFQRQRGKVAHRAQGYVMIAMGNHKVTMVPRCLVESNITIYHYNIGSREQFVEKMVQGGRELERHKGRHGGRHWRYFYSLYKQGILEEEYDRVIGRDCVEKLKADGFLVIDDTMSDFFQRAAIAAVPAIKDNKTI